MVQQTNRSPLTALRVGQAISELARIAATPYDLAVGFDIETTGKNPRKNVMIMVQLKPYGKKPLLLDVRGEDRGALRDALLPLMRDSKRVFVGQNLLFELHWMLSYLGMEVNDLHARFEDTMLRELVILGLGLGDAAKRGLAVNMHDIGERYDLPVHKDEQKWFINLDKPRKFYADGSYSYVMDKGGKDVEVYWHSDHTPYEENEGLPGGVVRESDEQWYQPFSQKILEYGRQDVSVVHPIREKQQEIIERYGLQQVIDIETRALPPTAGMQHYGVSVDREKWLGFMRDIDNRAEELAAKLHEKVDVAVLEDRRQKWMAQAEPYQAWSKAKQSYMDAQEATWPKTGKGKRQTGWGEYKKEISAQYDLDHPKPSAPGPLKDGVNLNSSPQMQVAFRSRGHQLESTAEGVLTPLVGKDPVIRLYLEWKDYQTARTKYGPAFLDEHAPEGTLYAAIQQIGAETGRYAFKEPNVQQVPARGAGEHLREALVPRKGFVFLDADFTNVELMIVAYISRDPVMMQAFNDGEDLHARTAEIMFGLRDKQEYLDALAAGVTPKRWTDDNKAVMNGVTLNVSYRSIAKTIGFGLFYGMGANTLSSRLRIPLEVARQLMRLFRGTYKVAIAWLRSQGDRVEYPDEDGRVYAKTLGGRRRWFNLPVLTLDKNTTADEAVEALEKHKKQLAEIQRQLGNHPVQGTSADVTKLAIALWHERYGSPEKRLICTIHDELLLEVRDDPEIIEEANSNLGEVMYEALTHFLKGMKIKVPVGLVADYWKH